MLVQPKPEWLKIRPPTTEKFANIKEEIKALGLNTVCQEAHCPNMSECWSGGTATFMVMGDTCTRACKFCNVKTTFPAAPLDAEEPRKIASLLTKWNLDYIVLTSVDRDDLADQGAGHFALCVREAKKASPKILVEVLIPDFRGEEKLLDIIINSEPDVIAHNIETVENLQKKVRDPRAGYKQSLNLLEQAKKKDPRVYTKTSLMLGLGETREEVIQTMKDLRRIGVDIITFGQYLRPSEKHLPVEEFVKPEQFNYYKKVAEVMGFLYVASGPFVRSSYRAGELFLKGMLNQK
ncbi:MAG: lipoyl synthase [Candidatus Aenigmatarchaeota archaeon]